MTCHKCEELQTRNKDQKCGKCANVEFMAFGKDSYDNTIYAKQPKGAHTVAKGSSAQQCVRCGVMKRERRKGQECGEHKKHQYKKYIK